MKKTTTTKQALRLVLFLTGITISFSTQAGNMNHRIRLGGGVASQTMDLTSKTFSVNQPYSSGSLAFVSYDYYSVRSGLNFGLDYAEGAQTHKLDAVFTPTEIKVKQKFINMKVMVPVGSDPSDDLTVGVGYAGILTDAPLSTPNIAFVRYDLHALSLIAKAKIFHRSDLELSLQTRVSLPFRYVEYDVQSGVNGSAWMADVRLETNYRLTESWSFWAMLNYQYQSASFDGLGTRGTLNLSEKKQTILFPVGVSYEF